MRDILQTLESWHQAHEQIGLATVIETWGSSPRQVGSKLAVTLKGGIAGSVSAGCVENDVIQAARACAKSGRPTLLRTAVSEGGALEAGLACGGTAQILVEPFALYEPLFARIVELLNTREPFGLVSVLEGPETELTRKRLIRPEGPPEGDLPLADGEIAALRLRLAAPGGFMFESGGRRLFLDLHPRLPRLVIVGAVHIAEFLVPMARLAGFELVVVDPRAAFATPERFPQVDRLLRQWPAEALEALRLDTDTYVAVLSHDTKLDDPALQAALASPARYVGVLGSRRSLGPRLNRLKEAGVPEDAFARLRAPIGLPLGSRSAVDIAVSILAELVQARHAGSPDAGNPDGSPKACPGSGAPATPGCRI
jgi:xanthine dehydrogenase accessory factor